MLKILKSKFLGAITLVVLLTICLSSVVYAAEVGYISYLSMDSNSTAQGSTRDYLYTKHKISLTFTSIDDPQYNNLKIYLYKDNIFPLSDTQIGYTYAQNMSQLNHAYTFDFGETNYKSNLYYYFDSFMITSSAFYANPVNMRSYQ